MSEAILARGIGSNESTFDVKATATLSYSSGSNTGNQSISNSVATGHATIAPPCTCFMAEIIFNNPVISLTPSSFALVGATSSNCTITLSASRNSSEQRQILYSASGTIYTGIATNFDIGELYYRATLIGDNQVNQASSLYLFLAVTSNTSWTGTIAWNAFTAEVKYI